MHILRIQYDPLPPKERLDFIKVCFFREPIKKVAEICDFSQKYLYVKNHHIQNSQSNLSHKFW